MDLFGLIVTTIVGLILAAVVDWGLTLQERLKLMERKYQEALSWSDKYQRDAANALTLVGQIRQEYAVLLLLHHENTARDQADAWQVGLRLKK